MDLQAIKLSSLRQVRISPLRSILLQCSRFPTLPVKWFLRLTSQMACKGFSTDSLKSTSISSVLFPDSICFWTSAKYQVLNISALYEGYMLMAILKIVLRKCYRNSFRKMSQMMRNKDMRWTKIWALLLVCVIQADAKLKWMFFKVNKFRGVCFREGFFREIF